MSAQAISVPESWTNVPAVLEEITACFSKCKIHDIFLEVSLNTSVILLLINM